MGRAEWRTRERLCRADGIKECFGCGAWIGGLGNGSTDDEPIGACGDSFGCGEGAFLVVGLIGGGADAWGDELDIGGDQLSEGGDFEGGTDEALETGFKGEGSEAFDLVGDVGLHAYLGEGIAVEAGEDGDAEEERGWAIESLGGVMGGGESGLEHGLTAGGMECEHLDVEFDGGGDGAGDGIGDIVEFEVEEDGSAGGSDLADEVGAAVDEQFVADFPGAGERADGGDEMECT